MDPNILNFVRLPHGWASVDWENSGWGDPAFELADLMAHPADTSVSPEAWTEILDMYCQFQHGRLFMIRIQEITE